MLKEIHESLLPAKGKVFLLHDKSGKKKIDAYIELIQDALSKGLGSIVLTPEIGSTGHLIGLFKEKFGKTLAVIHSGLKDKERTEEWEKIMRGERMVVLGTRTAVFSPVKNLKLIILDEEHESTYKSERSPRYDTRAVAEYLSANFGVISVFGSQTPSVDSYYKALAQKYPLITLEPNPAEAHPQIEVINMKNEGRKLLSKKFREEIRTALTRNEKVILFINRRGFFTSVICRECGTTVNCPKCSVSLSYHFKKNILECGHCGFTSPTNIVCPKCQSTSLAFIGIGTQRIEEEVSEVFPKAKVVRIDRDSTKAKGSHEKLFSSFTNGPANVLIGTQMVTKGLNMANVSLVGVVSADTMLSVPDFRSAENAFDQISQLIGRVAKNGKVIIQTLNPNHYAIKCAVSNNYEEFYNEEIALRKELYYPPFSTLISIIIAGHDEKKTEIISNDLSKLLKNREQSFTILGPAKHCLYKVRQEYRRQIVLKGSDINIMREKLKEALLMLVVPREIRVTVDVEPVSLV